MELSTTSIFGVTVTVASKKDILLFIHQFMHAPSGDAAVITIATPNTEQVMLAQEQKPFKTVLNTFDIALPDGKNLQLANWRIKDRKLRIKERISGVDFLQDLCRLAVTNKWPIACIGGRDGVAECALGKLQELFPGLTGWASDGPEIVEGTDVIGDVMTVIDRMKKAGTRMVFIGFGAPKQEFFMEALEKRLKKDMPSESIILMVVGGSFDMIAGKVKRAPKFVQTIGFEWLWRLKEEPWRWRRQIVLWKFIWYVLTQKFV